jgi:non-heme chloroperoxidase
MPSVKSHDGTQLFCRRWGEGRPIVFVHGWAMSSESWQSAMLLAMRAGYQAIAYDRRGGGRSDDPGRGYDYDSLADDLAAVLEEFDVRDAILVGHSMGCGEIARYLTRYGAGRVAKVVMAAPALPFQLKTADNPEGRLERPALTAMREQWVESFADWLAPAVQNAFGDTVQPQRAARTLQIMLQCSLQAAIETNIANAETDLRADLAQITTATLILHGDNDASCPLEATGRRVAALMPRARLKVYPGATHALVVTDAAKMVDDIVAFAAEEPAAMVA